MSGDGSVDIKHFQKPSKPEFLTTVEVEHELRNMIGDVRFNTHAITNRDSDGNIKKISFFKRHATYLKTHPKVDPAKYLLNLRTMTRVRR